MQRVIACFGAGAMLLALLTAPLFHSHDRDDHGSHISVVHAHLPESEEADHSDSEVEPGNSHDRARWIDFFTFQAPPAVFEVAIDLSEKLPIPVIEEREKVTIASVPRAHSPPGARRFSPRSPPSV
jgi:hypothetical protein